jgi:hypothetical protein
VGVGPDVVARSLAERLAQQWGQPVLVDNKPGASGIVAFTELRRTAPDGHTLFLADTATLAVNPLLHASLPYDPARDLVPLTLLFHATFVLWVGGSSRFANLAAMLAAARSAPGSVSYGTLGNGHATHVAIETFAPRRWCSDVARALQGCGGDVGGGGGQRGRLHGLQRQLGRGPVCRRTVATAGRGSASAPAGTGAGTHPGRGGGAARRDAPVGALVAPAGTPAAVVEQLQRDILAALHSPDLRGRAEQAGLEITPSTPQAVRERMQADTALYAPLVKEVGSRRSDDLSALRGRADRADASAPRG